MSSKVLYLFTTISVLGIFVVQEAGYPLWPLFIFAGVVFHFLHKPTGTLLSLILCLCTSSEVASMLFCAVLFVLHFFEAAVRRDSSSRMFASPLDKRIKIFILYAFCVYLAGQFYQVNILSYFFWALTFLNFWFSYLYFRYRIRENALPQLLHCLVLIIVLEICLAVLKHYYTGNLFLVDGRFFVMLSLADLFSGTFNNSHNFGIFMLNAATLLLAVSLAFRLKRLLLLVFAILFVCVLSDVKTILFSYLISWFSVTTYFLFYQKRKAAVYLSPLIIISLIGVMPFLSKQIETSYSEKYQRYVEGDYNNKFEFYSRALRLENRNIFHYLVGYGPGTCGSRAANVRAQNLLHKKEDSAGDRLGGLVPAFDTLYTERHLADLWTFDYLEKAQFRSSLLGNPFNSIASLLFELGWLGFFLWLSVYYAILQFSQLLSRSAIMPKVAWFLASSIGLSMMISGSIAQSMETPLYTIPFGLSLALLERYMHSSRRANA